jgi:hypothetical protein
MNEYDVTIVTTFTVKAESIEQAEKLVHESYYSADLDGEYGFTKDSVDVYIEETKYV